MQLETEREELSDKLERHADSSGNQERVLTSQIDALNKNIELLESGLSEEQTRHAKEMAELSANLKEKL
jgi:chaperonin cofactor prefoldin